MKQKKDIYQEVTDKFITAIESGTVPWQCPWDKTGDTSLPTNHSTGNVYQGINVISLWMAQHLQQFASSRWMTYKQAQAAGGQVRKNEESNEIFFFKILEKELDEIDQQTGENKIIYIPLPKVYKVFNLDQIDGIDVEIDDVPSDKSVFDPIETMESVLNNSGIKINEGGLKAFYRISTDEITMPNRFRFSHASSYYASVMHELTHATKHKTRCDREHYRHDNLKVQYAFEELVAEIGSTFILTDLGINESFENHASYIDSWLTLLKDDKRAIFKAAAQAQKAHHWVIENCHERKDVTDTIAA
jgi:antirestriction protein ArdC